MPEVPIPEAMRRARQMLASGRAAQAAFVYRQVVRQDPGYFEAQLKLGTALLQAGNLDEAAGPLAAAARLRPDFHGTYVNLGRLARARGQLEEAVRHLTKAVELEPAFAPGHQALGSALRQMGDLDGAVAAFRRAVQIQPDYKEAHSNLAYALYFHRAVSPVEIVAEHRRWAERFADPLLPRLRPHPNDRDPARRLRLGYVSPNLNHHVVGYFMEPVLREHDRAAFDVVCYSDADREDDQSRRLQAHAGTWRPTRGLSDEALAEQVRQDRVDLLVDLALHMRGSRLVAFAHKPAPVQATYLAYCGTSGMRQMDYCLADEHLAPRGQFDDQFTERVERLAGGYWCYSPSPDSPGVGPGPARANGYVTFGSLNSYAKHNGPLLDAWAGVLRAVPDSRLVLHAGGGLGGRPSLPGKLLRHGLDPGRVDVVDYVPREQYLAQYHRIDVALDPFPYNGGTTSLDALWMGVPVVTLAGRTPVGRAGVTILSRLGLPHVIAHTPDEYVQIAARLAADLPALAALRGELRQRLKASPLMDAAGFTRGLESAYRAMWRRHCVEGPAAV